MYCGKCGKELKPGDRFCPSCGSPAPKPGPNGPGGGKNRGLIAALLIAALLLGAAGGAFWYWNSRRTPGSADPGGDGGEVVIGGTSVSRRELSRAAEEADVTQAELIEAAANYQEAGELIDALMDEHGAEDFDSMSEREQRAAGRAMAEELAESGLVKDGCRYDADSKLITFEYAQGGSGVIMLGGFDDGDEPVLAAGGSADATGLYCLENDKASARFRELHDDAFTRDGDYGPAVQSIRLRGDVTVETMESLAGRDIVIFCMHGTHFDGESGLVLEERATLGKNLRYFKYLYRDEIRHMYFVGKKDAVYVVFPGFFTHAYDRGELNGLYLVESCSFFGCDHVSTRRDDDFAETLVSLGVDAVVGFHNSVYAHYGIPLMGTVLQEMSRGASVSAALETARGLWGADDGGRKPERDKYPAYPCLVGDGDYILGSVGVQTLPPADGAGSADAERLFRAFLEENRRFDTPLYPHNGGRFEFCSYALEDVSGDGVPELIVASSQDTYFSAEHTGVLVFGIGRGQTVEPLWYMDLDAVYQELTLVNGRWLAVDGHGTGGGGERTLMTADGGVVRKVYVYWEESGAPRVYTVDDRSADASLAEDLLERLAVPGAPASRVIVFTPLPSAAAPAEAPGESLLRREEQYDSAGRLTAYGVYTYGGGRLERVDWYDDRGSLTSFSLYTYENGVLTLIEDHDAAGIAYGYTRYSRGADGSVTITSAPYGEVMTVVVQVFNSDGLVEAEQIYCTDSGTTTLVGTTEYDYAHTLLQTVWHYDAWDSEVDLDVWRDEYYYDEWEGTRLVLEEEYMNEELVSRTVHEYDAAGRETRAQCTVEDAFYYLEMGWVETYEYDANGRLRSARLQDNNGTILYYYE